MAALPRLNHLNLNFAGVAEEGFFKIPSDAIRGAFLSLRTLTISTTNSTRIPSAFINSVDSDHLEKFAIRFYHEHPPGSLADIFRALKSNPKRLISLKSFALCTQKAASPSSILPHLFAFSNIRVLSLPGTLSEIGDDNLSDIAKAWPHLEDLSIVSIWSNTAKATLQGLFPLSVYCPKLKRLRL
ncbi:hypothetical protein SERLA73DRAFT_174806, partial [Serpula lacrymans var. lacrymans S7.3]